MPSLTCTNCGSLVLFGSGADGARCPACGTRNVLSGELSKSANQRDMLREMPPIASVATRVAPEGVMVAVRQAAPRSEPQPTRPPREARVRVREPRGVQMLAVGVLGLLAGSVSGIFGALIALRPNDSQAALVATQADIQRLNAELRATRKRQTEAQERVDDLQRELAAMVAQTRVLQDRSNELQLELAESEEALQAVTRDRDRLHLALQDRLYDEGWQPANGPAIRPGQPIPEPVRQP